MFANECTILWNYMLDFCRETIVGQYDRQQGQQLIFQFQEEE